MVKFAVVIPYFNPAGYVSHERKLARTLAAFKAAGLAADVYLTGAGGSHPLDAQIAYWDADCPYLWHKERLINLAVRRLPDEYTASPRSSLVYARTSTAARRTSPRPWKPR